MKSSNIGGQAVLEGIMMKNRETYSVAVRKPDGEIEVDIQEYKGVLPWKAPQKIPFIRGIFNFAHAGPGRRAGSFADESPGRTAPAHRPRTTPA